MKVLVFVFANKFTPTPPRGPLHQNIFSSLFSPRSPLWGSLGEALSSQARKHSTAAQARSIFEACSLFTFEFQTRWATAQQFYSCLGQYIAPNYILQNLLTRHSEIYLHVLHRGLLLWSCLPTVPEVFNLVGQPCVRIRNFFPTFIGNVQRNTLALFSGTILINY